MSGKQQVVDVMVCLKSAYADGRRDEHAHFALILYGPLLQ